MKVKDYLKQAYRLDHRIDSDIEELGKLRSMAASISSPTLGERVQTSKKREAPFEKTIMKIVDVEHKIDEEIDLLVDLKTQMREVIQAVEDVDEQLVLRYRYIHNMTWDEISDELAADNSTVRRWHGHALLHVKLPENPIII